MTKDTPAACGPVSADRRKFLTAGSAAALGAAATALASTAADAFPQPLSSAGVAFEAETDIVVVGGGGADGQAHVRARVPVRDGKHVQTVDLLFALAERLACRRQGVEKVVGGIGR